MCIRERIIGAVPPLLAASTNKVPTIGPVQENETIAKAKAIPKIPIIPFFCDCRSAAFDQRCGNLISKAPKNEMANRMRMLKKIRLNHTLVDNALSASAPKILVTMVPRSTYNKMMDTP